MLVYRVCKSEEVENIFSTYNFSKLGKVMKRKNYEVKSVLYSHNYVTNERYLHFFESFDSIFYLDNSVGNYVCIYDISDSILKSSEGVGYYFDYLNYRDLKEVKEYAIKSKDVLFEYLISALYIEKSFLVEDFFDGNTLEDYTYKVYEKCNVKTLKL